MRPTRCDSRSSANWAGKRGCRSTARSTRSDLDTVFGPHAPGLAVALGGGLLIGLDRERRKRRGHDREAAGIRSFATGGIGGVHRGWSSLPDVSADLPALSRSRVVVTCAGAKSILDLPATLEWLDTLGVPVIGVGTRHFPCFICPPDASLPVSAFVTDARCVAKAAAAHWSLGPSSAVLAVQPCPTLHAMDRGDFDRAVQVAEREAEAGGVRGQAVTPFLLGRLAALTEGRSLKANVALLLHNARTAAEIARSLLDLARGS